MWFRVWRLSALFFVVGSIPSRGGGVLQYSAYPDSTNNFAEASYSCVIPVPQPRAILFLAGGTDSDVRPWLAEPRWRGLAEKERLVLISACLRGAGESYEVASKGSGQSLLDAIDSFAMQSGESNLPRLPLILYGHSAGAQFAFNFACWKPDRVRAIVCLKSGPLYATDFRKPPPFAGLFIVGERDLAGRIREVSQAYAMGRSAAAPWCYAFQPGAGHGSDGCRELVDTFITAINSPPAGTAHYARLDLAQESTAPAMAKTDINRSWLPNDAFAGLWRHFVKSTSLQPLLVLREEEEKGVASWRPIIALPEKVREETGVVRFEYAITTPGNRESLTQGKVTTSNPAISVSIARHSDSEWRVSGEFDPHRVALGGLKAELRTQLTTAEGKVFLGSHTFFTRVFGPVSASPASIYYGVFPRQQTSTFNIHIRSEDPLEIRSCKAISSDPEFLGVTISPTDNKSTYQVTATIQTGARIGARSGHITFQIETDRSHVLTVPFYGFIKK